MLTSRYKEVWAEKRDSLMDAPGKLELYLSFKDNFGKESYLELNNYRNKNAITKMRISAHSLPIETGRYTGTPREERLCPLCKTGIGNELHYLLDCPNPKLVSARNAIIEQIGCAYPEFHTLNKDRQVRFILNGEDRDKVKYAGTLCAKILKVFKDELKSIETPVNSESMDSVSA